MFPGYQLPPLVRQSLVVKIVDRIRDLSIQKCSGCMMDYRFGSLHPCQKNSLTTRTELFLPQVLTEVLERIERLLDLHQNQFMFPVMSLLDFAREYVQQLTPDQVYDRQYINQDTADMFPYNNSWIVEDVAIIQDLREPVLQQTTTEVQNAELIEQSEQFPPCREHAPTNMMGVFAKLEENVKKGIKRKSNKEVFTPVNDYTDTQNQLFQACQEIDEEEKLATPKIKRRKSKVNPAE